MAAGVVVTAGVVVLEGVVVVVVVVVSGAAVLVGVLVDEVSVFWLTDGVEVEEVAEVLSEGASAVQVSECVSVITA